MLGDIHRHPALAHVAGRNFQGGAGFQVPDGHRNSNWNAGVAPTFALHQGASRPKTRFRPLAGHRLVQDKMSSNVKHRPQAHRVI